MTKIDEELFSKIALDIQREREMGGLAGTIYEDYAYEVAERYLTSLQEPTDKIVIDEFLKEKIIKAIEQGIGEGRKLGYSDGWNDCIMKKEYKYKEEVD